MQQISEPFGTFTEGKTVSNRMAVREKPRPHRGVYDNKDSQVRQNAELYAGTVGFEIQSNFSGKVRARLRGEMS